MKRIVAGLGLLALVGLPHALSAQAQPATSVGSAAAGDAPVYLVYFWRARPGKAAEYARYIKEVAEPIDAEAQRLGAFEEVHTYTPFMVTGAPGTDWTEMRVFRLKNFAALDSFSIKIDSATARLYPDPERRHAATSGRSADLRDLVREEIWRDFH